MVLPFVKLPHRPLRITFVLAAVDISGGCRVICTYAAELRKLGHKVTIVSRPPRPVSIKSRISNFLKGNPTAGSQRDWGMAFDALKTDHHKIDSYRDIRSDDVPDADVVIATWWETAEWISRYPASKGAKVYFIQHHEIHNPALKDRVEATWRLPMQKIVIARWLETLAREQFGDSTSILVPNSVDPTQFYAPERGKQRQPTVGLMYSKAPYKGCDIALKGFEIARAKNPNLQLVTFGYRPSEEPIPLPDAAKHTIQPPQDKIREIYAACDAWIVASRSEGFGLPILEAMACRTPVIATPTGAAPELIEQGGGMIVPHENPPAIADAILRITSLPENDWKSLSNQAYCTSGRYTWQEATALFEQVMLHEAAKVR